MKDVTKSDYRHTKRVCKDFKIKNLGEYHDFYGHSNTLLLADVIENFRNMCLGIYGLDPAYFLCTGISMTTNLKNYKSKIILISY